MAKEKNVKTTSKGTSKGTQPMGHGVGRRKTAVARVWLKKGSGKVMVNGKSVDQYFDTDVARQDAVKPFTLLQSVTKKYDVNANVRGGGIYAQAGAVKLGIARALVSSEEDLRKQLRDYKLLTVDSRQVERKKYGQRGARRKFQFVKR